MSGLCLAAGAIAVAIAADAFTLSWTHSVERIEWQEDWRVTAAGLVIEEARVKGHGAGMEPPAGSVNSGGWWRYRPALGPLGEVTLARSDAVADWRLCVAGACRPLDAYLPRDGRQTPVTIRPCAE